MSVAVPPRCSVPSVMPAIELLLPQQVVLAASSRSSDSAEAEF